jgi:hypothetical protein
MAFLLLLTVLPLSAMAGHIGEELKDLGEQSFFVIVFNCCKLIVLI